MGFSYGDDGRVIGLRMPQLERTFSPQTARSIVLGFIRSILFGLPSKTKAVNGGKLCPIAPLCEDFAFVLDQCRSLGRCAADRTF